MGQMTIGPFGRKRVGAGIDGKASPVVAMLAVRSRMRVRVRVRVREGQKRESTFEL